MRKKRGHSVNFPRTEIPSVGSSEHSASTHLLNGLQQFSFLNLIVWWKMILACDFQRSNHRSKDRTSPTIPRMLDQLLTLPISTRLLLMANPDGFLWLLDCLLILKGPLLLLNSFPEFNSLHRWSSLPEGQAVSNDRIHTLVISLDKSIPCHLRSLQTYFQRLDSPITYNQFWKSKCRLSLDSNFKSPLAHTWERLCLPSPAGPLSCPFLWNKLPRIHLHIPQPYTGGIYSSLMQPSPAEQAEGNWAGVLPVERGLGKAPALLHPHHCPQFSLLPSIPPPFEGLHSRGLCSTFSADRTW